MFAAITERDHNIQQARQHPDPKVRATVRAPAPPPSDITSTGMRRVEAARLRRPHRDHEQPAAPGPRRPVDPRSGRGPRSALKNGVSQTAL
jgi:hypothetical protein